VGCLDKAVCFKLLGTSAQLSIVTDLARTQNKIWWKQWM